MGLIVMTPSIPVSIVGVSDGTAVMHDTKAKANVSENVKILFIK